MSSATSLGRELCVQYLGLQVSTFSFRIFIQFCILHAIIVTLKIHHSFLPPQPCAPQALPILFRCVIPIPGLNISIDVALLPTHGTPMNRNSSLHL
mmetsp:Transcript_24577/g.50606  ORF Transcript_24577/g.50606 Transcript_24577/m.50606 type:complete len:96 (+) Transcript_24577:1-288(+)